MANCIYCGAKTQLYLNGVAICVKCSDDLDAGRQPACNQRPTNAQSTTT